MSFETGEELLRRAGLSDSEIAILKDILDERARQDEKWGDLTNLPDGTGRFYNDVETERGQREYPELAMARMFDWRARLNSAVVDAFAESDPEKLYAELIQCAAVILAWASAIKRREK